MNLNKLYGVKDAANIIIIDAVTNKVALDIDYANKFDFDFSEDNIEYAMKNGVTRAIKFDGEFKGTLKISTDMMDASLLAFINRSKLLSSLTDIFSSEKFVVNEADEEVTLKETTIGALIGVNVIGKDGVIKNELTTATLSGNKVTLTGAKQGDIVKIYYIVNKEATHFNITGNKEVSSDYILYADVLGKTYEGGTKLPFQYKFYKVSPQSSVSLSYDGSSINSFEITLDVLVDADDNVCTYTEIPTE